MKWLKKLKAACVNRETVSYVIVGILTTLVDYLVFYLVNTRFFGARGMEGTAAVLIATALSWLAAVLFAYLANKLFVFRSMDFAPKRLGRELAGFFAARVISGVITFGMMWLFTGPLHWNEYAAKVLTSVFNMVFNYVASKLYIFRKK